MDKYYIDSFQSFRQDDEGTERMANFTAEIVEETRIVDGMNTASKLRIRGQMPAEDKPEPVELPEIEIDSNEFTAMNWPLQKWGARVILMPGSGIKDDMRTFIQSRSKPKVSTIFRHTGWAKVDGKPTYLHAGGGINEEGNNPSVSVRLPVELSRYNLATGKQPKEGFIAAMRLLGLSDRKEITYPLLAATVCPIFGPVDFGVHVAGRTGTYKSEMISLFQSFYGPEMDARNLPGSWSSTANALEAQAFLAKNAPFVIDDFVPQGASWQQRSYQQNADKIIRAQGNQAGRARLTDTSNLQPTMYPRGIILSTGEDIPEGHSVRARLLILELSPGDIEPSRLTVSQKDRPLFCSVIAGLCSYLAKSKFTYSMLHDRIEQLRMKYNTVGHARTPSMLARLVTCLDAMLEYGQFSGFITSQEYERRRKEGQSAIELAGAGQQLYLEDSDPTDKFMAALRQVFAVGGGHLRSLNGGVPSNAVMVGWIEEKGEGELPTYKAKGPTIGWVSTQKGEIYLDINLGFNAIKKVLGADLALTKQTMLKRLKESGKLLRTDDARQRNTARVTADGHVRQVIVMSLADTLESQEVI